MTALHAEMVDQLGAFDGIALVENVFADRPRRTDATFLGNVLQHLVQFEFFQRSSLSAEGRRQQNGNGRDDKAQHETLLVQ
ncbi:hypothetical protein D3C76_1590910 [compost metagenome]